MDKPRIGDWVRIANDVAAQAAGVADEIIGCGSWQVLATWNKPELIDGEFRHKVYVRLDCRPYENVTVPLEWLTAVGTKSILRGAV